MPSTKKRVNLTIPDELYERIQAYKQYQGIASDASACLQLIVQQLNGLEQSQTLLRLVNQYSVEQLMEVSKEGFTEIKSLAKKLPQEQGLAYGDAGATCGVSRKAVRIPTKPCTRLRGAGYLFCC